MAQSAGGSAARSGDGWTRLAGSSSLRIASPSGATLALSLCDVGGRDLPTRSERGSAHFPYWSAGCAGLRVGAQIGWLQRGSRRRGEIPGHCQILRPNVGQRPCVGLSCCSSVRSGDRGRRGRPPPRRLRFCVGSTHRLFLRRLVDLSRTEPKSSGNDLDPRCGCTHRLTGRICFVERARRRSPSTPQTLAKPWLSLNPWRGWRLWPGRG